jgi:hypothetical protein
MTDYEKDPKYKRVYAVVKDFLRGANKKISLNIKESELEEMAKELTDKTFEMYKK